MESETSKVQSNTGTTPSNASSSMPNASNAGMPPVHYPRPNDSIDLSNEATENTESDKNGNKRKRVGGQGTRRTTFKAWLYFEKIFDEQSKTVKGRSNFCGVEYLADSSKNGTSAMIAHIPKCMKNPNNQKSGSTQTKLAFGNKEIDEVSGQMRSNLMAWKFDQDDARKGVAYMIVHEELPFRFVESHGFRHMLSCMCPMFSVPSRTTITRDCYDLYFDEKEKLKKFMKSSAGRICFTTDTWTSLQKDNYMCLTAHFIDHKWKLNKRVLNFCPIISHKGSDIGEAVVKCWMDWGINNIFTVTVDNASSNNTAIAYLQKKMTSWNKCILGGKWLHIRCMAHIMNLIVQDGLNTYNGAIDSIRAAVRFVRQSPARLNRFKEIASLEGIEYKKHLCLDVPTRWNSTYFMLSTTIGYSRVFESYCDNNPQMRESLESINRPGIPSYLDWEDARRLTSLLESFYHLTLQVSGTKYITSNEFLTHISDIDALLKLWKNGKDIHMSNMAAKMTEKFDKYWGEYTKMNKLIFIAAAMDPRRK